MPQLHELPAPPPVEVHALPLLRRLNVLRSPGVTQQEVDTFLEGLSTILPAHESPRVRADLMLDILDDSRLCALTSSEGTQVGAIALEVLLELGYPYALEVTPAMLARGRGPAPAQPLPLAVRAGLGVGAAAALLHGVGLLPTLVHSLIEEYTANGGHLPHQDEGAAEYMPLVVLMMLGTALLSGLGWRSLPRGLRDFVNGVQWVTGLVCVGIGALKDLHLMNFTPGTSQLFLWTGGLTLVSALCLRLAPEPDKAPVADA